MTVDARVAVVGLGSMGSAALWQLARRGVDAIGFEQFRPGHDRGAGHGETKIFRTAYAEGPEYVPLLRAALPLWRELEEETGRPLLTMTGGLMIGPPDHALIAGVLRSAAEHELVHRLLGPDEAMRRYPQLALTPEEHVVWEPRAGFLRPELAVVAAADRARELGARVVEGLRVDEVVDAGDHVEVRAGGRAWRAERAVVAAGAWFPELLAAGSSFWVERQVQAWFPLENGAHYHPERFGIFVRAVGDLHWYGFPSLDGRTIKVAFHHGGERTTADDLDRSVRPSDLEPLAEVARTGLRGLGPAPVRTQVCMYANTPDEAFVLGPLPSAPRIVACGPMSGHGFKFAPVVGEIAADLASGGDTAHDIRPFDPGRLPALARAGRR